MERYYTIEEVLSGYYEREFSRIEENENLHFSLVHKYRMKKIFGIFRKNSEKADAALNRAITKSFGIRRRVILAALIIILMTLLMGAINLQIKNGFILTEYGSEIYLKVTNAENSPKKIVAFNMLEVVPEGYKRGTVQSDKYGVSIKYFSEEEKGVLLFGQDTKQLYNPSFVAKFEEFQQTEINGRNALFLYNTDKERPRCFVIWDGGDYIYSLYGSFENSERVLELASQNQSVWDMKKEANM